MYASKVLVQSSRGGTHIFEMKPAALVDMQPASSMLAVQESIWEPGPEGGGYLDVNS